MASITFGMAASASNGTPGREKSNFLEPNSPFSRINSIFGAVPLSFGSTMQLFGTRAWSLFISLISMPLALRWASIMAYCSWFTTKPVAPVILARDCFVMSSFVGPRPPVVITMSFSLSNLDMVSSIWEASSPMESMLFTFTPIALRAFAIWDELVSTICPIRISSPIVHIDAVIIVLKEILLLDVYLFS